MKILRKSYMKIFLASAVTMLLSLLLSAYVSPEAGAALPYNQHDLITIQNFLAQSNGERTNAEIKGWDIDDPKTWDESIRFDWLDDDDVGDFGDIIHWVALDGELHLKMIRLSGDYNKEPFGALRLSDCIALEEISFGNTYITELYLEDLPALRNVVCYYNQIEKIELSNLPELNSIYCDRNKLTELSLPLMPKLTVLSCPDNELKTLDLSGLPNLQKLDCSSRNESPGYSINPKNQIEVLDLTKVPDLCELNCSNNRFTKLDISGTPALESLICAGNQLTELDLSFVPDLTTIDCSDNQLTALNIMNNPKLSSIGCSHNQLTELDLLSVPELQLLICDYNHLTKLDLSKVPALVGLLCSNNLLTRLELTDVPKVFVLDCSNNPFLNNEEHTSYLGGYPDGTFRPDEFITRAQAVTLFYRISKSRSDADPLCFGDIVPNAWYYQEASYFKQYFGFSSDRKNFDPDKPITRAEFAHIAASYVGFYTAVYVEDLWWLDDQALIEKYWEARIESCIASVSEQGWMTGFPDGTFRPEEPLTRAQAVKVINMMLDRKINPENLPADVPRYSDLSPSHWAYADIMEASIAHDYERDEDGSEIWK